MTWNMYSKSSYYLQGKKQGRRAGVVCMFENKIFCVHQKASGLIGLPKGCCEKNESDVECAVREFKEETGIYLNQEELKGCLVLNTVYNHVYFVKKVDRAFYEDSLQPRNFDQNEIDKLEWIDINELLHMKIASFTRQLIFKLQNHARNNTLFLYCSKLFEMNEKFAHENKYTTLSDLSSVELLNVQLNQYNQTKQTQQIKQTKQTNKQLSQDARQIDLNLNLNLELESESEVAFSKI